MEILAIETSCDETGAAIVSKNLKEDHVTILSNIIASSLKLHSKTGGIIPNVAAREQLKHILPVIEKAINDSGLTIENIDAIAVTQGPGLIGSLLVGTETAKTLSYLWNKPLIPVNHLLSHIYANWIRTDGQRPKNIPFPALCLLVSGGHTDLILMKSHNDIKWFGGTRDDAAGEAFDKIGRLLNLPYPAGPTIEKLAKIGNEKSFNFPRPMIGSKDFDFSFSGLKAAVMREVMNRKNINDKTKADIATCVQRSIIEVLVRKTLKAVKKYKVKSIILSGGVASNQKLRDTFKQHIKDLNFKAELFYPDKSLCTDNAAMIGTYAAFHPRKMHWSKITANPELYF